ncbi:MAG TPA: diaminopropionate ammonia-lyase [Microvirga sp.]|jgi:diaminopropionate ammonia-lyase
MFLANPRRHAAPPPRASVLAALGSDGRREVARHLAACPAHRATPLHGLPGQAASLGIAALHVKDEGQRLGLRSFKALGGAYSVMRLALAEAERRLGRALHPADLQSAPVRAALEGFTVACATDGNHGRSVAAGARLAGCASVIFIHGGVSETRAEAIAAFGARMVRVVGTYDDSVVEAARQAAEQGWVVVSDTSWDGYEAIPLMVMQGYTVAAGEAFDALPEPPTHLFLQAGVGGFAAAIAAHAVGVHGAAAPRVVVVEPERAACLFASARAGRLTTVSHGEATVMAMLECYEPSRLAWEVLDPLADGFMALDEASAPDAMRRLAQPKDGDPAIVAGESGAVGFAGLVACLADPEARRILDLGPSSRVLVFNTEGATDPALYRDLVGIDPSTLEKPGV